MKPRSGPCPKAVTLLVLLALPRCAIIRPVTELAGGEVLPCAAPGGPPLSAASLARPLTPDEAELLQSRYSARARAISEIIGAAPVLAAVERLRDNGARFDEQLAAQERFDDLVLAAELALHTTTGELECDRERMLRSQELVRAHGDHRARKLTAASLIVASLAALGTALLTPYQNTEWAQLGVGTAGALAVGELSGAEFVVHSEGELQLSRNALFDLLETSSRPTVLSPEAYAFISRPSPTRPGEASLREQLLRRWRDAGWLGRDEEQRARLWPLYFGSGGVYAEENLWTRARMLGELQIAITGMVDLLRTLYFEVHERWRSSR